MYVDSSALLKLVLREEGSPQATALWQSADVVTSSRLVHVESRAGLAAGFRRGRVRRARRAVLRERLGNLLEMIEFVELHPGLAAFAAELAERHSLRAGDAVHLASALTSDPGALFVCWDRDLCAAASAAGLDVVPPA